MNIRLEDRKTNQQSSVLLLKDIIILSSTNIQTRQIFNIPGQYPFLHLLLRLIIKAPKLKLMTIVLLILTIDMIVVMIISEVSLYQCCPGLGQKQLNPSLCPLENLLYFHILNLTLLKARNLLKQK